MKLADLLIETEKEMTESHIEATLMLIMHLVQKHGFKWKKASDNKFVLGVYGNTNIEQNGLLFILRGNILHNKWDLTFYASKNDRGEYESDFEQQGFKSGDEKTLILNVKEFLS